MVSLTQKEFVLGHVTPPLYGASRDVGPRWPISVNVSFEGHRFAQRSYSRGQIALPGMVNKSIIGFAGVHLILLCFASHSLDIDCCTDTAGE